MFGHDADMRLRDGSRVSVVGAGPSGSIFASQLLRSAHERGLALDVTLFDEKQFLREGPRGCNLCAGVICSDLLHDLADMGVELSGAHTQRMIEGYRFRTRAGELRMPRAAAYTVRLPPSTAATARPREALMPRSSFDELLLQHAMKLGAHFIPHRVAGVGLPSGPFRPRGAPVPKRQRRGAVESGPRRRRLRSQLHLAGQAGGDEIRLSPPGRPPRLPGRNSAAERFH